MERLLVDAAEIGLSGDAVGAMSNYELSLQLRGAQQRKDWWYRLGVSIAWHTANFAGAAMAGKLPDLEKVLAKMDKKKPPTRAQQKAQLQQIADRFGLKVKRVPREKANV